MDLFETTSLFYESLEVYKTLVLNLIILVISAKFLLFILQYPINALRWLIQIMDYELDMTTPHYCKDVAEVDNSLQTQSKLRDIEDLIANRLGNAEKSSDAVDNYQSYPNGWLPLMESSQVKAGQIERAIIMGRDVIVVRSFEGSISVMDAYCPHMGVHIGIGGQVVRVGSDSCVQCPFHGWTYRMSDGQCVDIPYLKNRSCDSIPRQARLRAWLSCEVDNFIYIWHHVDDEPPSWHLEPTPELSPENEGRWALAGRSYHKSNLDWSDMLENGADMHHFEGIHNDLFIFGGELMKVRTFSHLQKYFKHCWDPDWQPVIDDEGKVTHRAEFRLDSWINFFGLKIFFIEVRASQLGPASVTLRYHSNWYGPGILKMNAIRLGGRQTIYAQQIYTKDRFFNRFMAKCVLYGEVKQLERDLLMWNHRKFLKKPILVPEDRVIKRFRLWYAQFYKRKQKVIINDVANGNVI